MTPIRPKCVRDDGYCWLYVVMSIMGMYTPTVKRGRINARDPTLQERQAARHICEALKATDDILFSDMTKAPD